jgi:NADPH-dependent 2,4-dienoyl-CoA reductase/sulfur reductase-like enzyme
MALDPDATVAVVGASVAGLRAAETVRGEGHRGPVVVVGAESHLPYDRPPLSKQFLAGTWDLDRIALR